MNAADVVCLCIAAASFGALFTGMWWEAQYRKLERSFVHAPQNARRRVMAPMHERWRTKEEGAVMGDGGVLARALRAAADELERAAVTDTCQPSTRPVEPPASEPESMLSTDLDLADQA